MTIDELIERLEEYRDELGGGTEVRLMTQQNWPFENEIVGLASGAEINDRGGDGDGEVDAMARNEPGRSRTEAETRPTPVGTSRRVVPAA